MSIFWLVVFIIEELNKVVGLAMNIVVSPTNDVNSEDDFVDVDDDGDDFVIVNWSKKATTNNINNDNSWSFCKCITLESVRGAVFVLITM